MSSLLVVNAGKTYLTGLLIAPDYTLKLYSNDKAPALGDVATDYTEVSGGSYAAKTLTGGGSHWTLTGTTPKVAAYNTPQDFIFTTTTDDSGIVYGYYIVNGAGTLVSAKRFTSGGFTPVQFSRIRIHPAITLDNRP